MRFALLCVAFAATGCSHQVLRGGELNLNAMNDIAEETARVRGLKVNETIPAYGLTKEQVRKYFEQRFNSEVNRAWFDNETKVAHKLGILPAHIHLGDLYRRSYSKNAAALYERAWCHDDDDDETTPCDPIAGRMLIFTQLYPAFVTWPIDLLGVATDTDWLMGLIVSHELVHALQDQHFGLSTVLPSALYATDEDAALARKSVVESEANLVSYAYLFGVDLESWPQRNAMVEYLVGTRFLTEGLAMLANRKSPSFYTRVLTSQYFDGMRFVQRTANAGGGYHALNLAYEDALPESTEQILHPEKLFGRDYDPPARFLPLEAPSGWTSIDTSTLGELRLRALLEAFDTGKVDRVANGWGGDRYDVLEKDERVLLVWRATMDSPRDAEELERAWRAVLRKKYPGRLSTRTGALADDGWTLLRVEPRVPREGEVIDGVPTQSLEFIALRREGARLLVLEGLEPERWSYDAERIWQQHASTVRATERAAVVAPERPPRAGPGLARSYVLPHRDVEVRAGTDGLYLRWGLRPHLELSFPGVISVGHEDALGLTRASIGVFGQQGVNVTRVFLTPPSTLAQAGVALEVQSLVDNYLPSRVELRGSVAGLIQLGDRARVSLGAAAVLDGESFANAPRLRFELGGVSTRGLTRAPLIEVRALDQLHGYASGAFVLEDGAGELQVDFGLLYYY